MTTMEYQRELFAFAEKIQLAKLEEAKAHERVVELEYAKAQFELNCIVAAMSQPSPSPAHAHPVA